MNKMNQVTMFRVLVVASIATGIVGGSVDYLFPDLLPAVLNDAYESYSVTEEPRMSYVLTLGGFIVVLFIGTVVGTIGLLLLKPWSRQLSLWVSVLGMASYPFVGPTVCSGWSAMLIETSMMLWGAALAMAYFAEIKVKFERDSANVATQSPREEAGV